MSKTRKDPTTAIIDGLKAFIADEHYELNTRLPPEREMCERMNVSRTALRKALGVMEADGLIWRHVGRGTFVGNMPLDQTDGISSIISRTNPIEVMEARLRMEPEMARLAALHATTADLETMQLCYRKSCSAREWRVYETWDNKLHLAIAEATHNAVLISLYQTLNTVRRAIVWGRSRQDKPVPDVNHHSHAEHLGIIESISNRHMEDAAYRMGRHLESVQKNLMKSYTNTPASS